VTASLPSAENDLPPTNRQRLLGAIPLFIGFFLVAGGIRATLIVAKIYEELEIEGDLPLPTVSLVSATQCVTRYPWILTMVLFAVSWLYFSFVPTHRTRLLWFNRILIPAMLTFSIGAAYSLYLPLTSLMGPIGK
jgi:hypothetical protein